MKKEKTLVDKLKGSIGKALASGVILAGSYTGANAATPVDTFTDLLGASPSGGKTCKNVLDSYTMVGDNVMIVDSNSGVESVISKEGVIDENNYYKWIGEKHQMGLMKEVSDGYLVGGSVSNENVDSNYYNDILAGWFNGWMYHNNLADGERPTDVWIVRDLNGDGMGYTEGGAWYLGSDDTIYYTKDILIGENRIRGDVRELPVYIYNVDVAWLPHMVIKPQSDLEDLEVLCDNWLSNDCSLEGNGNCYGADWNRDGKVNMRDFSEMAKKWTNYENP